MKALQKLAGQTAIYGLPSIVGRLLYYFLVPLHTSKFLPSEYGEIVEMYAYVSFLVVLLTYGMETAYFRFQTKSNESKNNVFSTVILSLFGSTTLFIFLATFFSHEVADFLKYSDDHEYVIWFAFIVGLDAISSIPLARLRIENKAMRFVSVNVSNIAVNVGLNWFWIGYCMTAFENGETNFLIDNLYSSEIGIGYVFIANLLASAVKFLLLTPAFFRSKLIFDRLLLKELLIYSSPILIASIAIIINETSDRILLKWLLLDQMSIYEVKEQVGIYGGVYKLSIIISLFIQAFRYAAEPFFFSNEKEKDAKETYALIMKYFVIICSIIFLGVMLYIDQLKYFVNNEAYWNGLNVVPILLFANIFFGIFYNLSIWYKLNEKTRYGAYIAVMGAFITIVLNVLLIPILGYTGSAWATLACYFSMATVSYFLGQKHYKINYPLKSIFFYLSLAFAFYWLSTLLDLEDESIFKFGVNSLFLMLFLSIIFVLEKPKKALIS